MFYLQYPLLGSSATFPAFISVSMQDSSELLSRPQSSSGNLKKNGQRHVLGVDCFPVNIQHTQRCVFTHHASRQAINRYCHLHCFLSGNSGKLGSSFTLFVKSMLDFQI